MGEYDKVIKYYVVVFELLIGFFGDVDLNLVLFFSNFVFVN